MSSRRFALATVVAFAAMVTPAAAAQEQPPPWLKLENGVTAKQFAFANAIEEVVFVETTLDTDGDGARDRIRIRISRPGETRTEGIDVPVIFEHSPYRGEFGNAVTITSTSRCCRRSTSPTTTTSAPRRPARASRTATANPDLPARSTTTTSSAVTRRLGESIGTGHSTGARHRRPGGDARDESRHRLAQRTRPRLRRSRPPGHRRLGERRRRYDRHLLHRHAAQPGRHHRRRRAEGDHPRLRDLELVRLLPRQRAGGRTALGGTGCRRERVPRRGHRRARRLHRPADDGSVRARPAATGQAAGPAQPATGARSGRRATTSTTSVACAPACSWFTGSTTGTSEQKAFAEWWYRLADRRIPRKLWLHNGGHGGPGPVGTAGRGGLQAR